MAECLDEEPEYETGPFCRHFGDPIDCEETCLRCGHRCPGHSISDPYECFECDCEGWREWDD
jgi:hypothetical protein